MQELKALLPGRSRKGFSVVTVLCVGLVASIWMMGTAAMMMPAAVRVSKERLDDLTRSSSEASLDWVIAKLNDPQQRATVDGTTVRVPSDVLAQSNLSGSVTVANEPAPTSSYLYDQTCDWAKSTWNSAAVNPQNNVYGGNGWRTITATVSAGPIGSKTVRVVLKPVYSQSIISQGGSSTSTPYFNYSLGSATTIGGTGNLTTNSYQSTTTTPLPLTGFQTSGADVTSNGTVSFPGNVNIGGNLNVFATGAGAVSLGTRATVAQNVITNGTASGNIVGIHGTYTPNANQPLMTVPPCPTPPSTATQTTINLSGNSTMTLASGDYVVSSISISQNGQLRINANNGPVNIYVNGSGSTAGITIGGLGVSNPGQPTNLRIWYPGSGSVQVGGNGNLSGAIYAPNAPVTFNGNGAIYGAVVGASISIVGNPILHYDKNFQSAGPSYTATTVTNKPANIVNYYQAVSWTEL